MSTRPEPTRPPRRQHPRFQHRQTHDATAHADMSGAPPRKIEHPLVCNERAQLITDAKALAELIDALREDGSFAYDSEFIGETSYLPRLCLIQAASSRRIALIDPLAELDLLPFWELVADPSVEKIVHAGQQDVEPVFRAIHRPPANLLDTQIAGGFIGLGYPLSLSRLVQEKLGAKLTKGLTFTHWDRRPLTEQQLRYAADDVRFLPAIRAAMKTQLEALGHAAAAAEESASLADPSLYQFDADSQYQKIRGAMGLPPRNLAILRELTVWRNSAAQEEDLPPRSLVRDEILMEMARTPPKSSGDFHRVRGLPRPVEQSQGAAILAAIARAQALPVDQLPQPRVYEPSPREKFAADSLWGVLQVLATGQQIDPGLVTSRQEIGELYRLHLAGEKALDFRILRGWRDRMFGQPLLSMLEGKAELSASWKDSRLSSRYSPAPPG